ncbi:GntR family transcriptional regulator [Microbispora triticiradicis]|uniref:GntR family transcriptional regulator n=2 Tax=Microbispora triticiradicis TaxID=2200763 RepID=A0ABX9LKH2_9ACTN|nr:GntR family transcriptional regulator [Microbispora triticiradicis]
MTAMSGTPAYVQVAADLRSQIEKGVLPEGAQLPSMTRLREQYGVSNTVVRDALNELRREGLVVGQQGKGVFVRSRDAALAAPATEGLEGRLDELAETVRGLERRLTLLEERGAVQGRREPNG